jgi:hypothetical protein
MATTPNSSYICFINSTRDLRTAPLPAPYNQTKREEGASPQGEANHRHQIGVIKR